MLYPEKIRIEKLNSTAPEIMERQELFEIVDDLLGGYNLLKQKIGKYLTKRPDEELEVYQYRKKVFSYNPIVSTAISQLSNRLNSANFTVAGVEGKDFLNELRGNIDGRYLNEKKFLKEVFMKLVKYKRVYAFIDYPILEERPRNRFEEEKYYEERKPYIKLYDNRTVINYEYDSKRELKWIKLREVIEHNSAFEDTQNFIRWTIIDQERIVVYESSMEKKDKNKFTIKGDVEDEYVETIDGVKKANGAFTVKKVRDFEHNYPAIPIVELEIPDNLWVIKEAIFLLLEHIRVHNNLTWTALIAGQIQRLFTPVQESSDSIVDYDEARMQFGNSKVLIGSGFSFNETSGQAINTITSYLDRLEKQIMNLIYSNGIDGTDRPMQESGVAKSMDFVSQENALSTYGEELLLYLERIYKKIAQFEGCSLEEIEDISVSGLNEFQLNSIESKIARIQSLLGLNVPISDTALKLVIADLESALTPTASVHEKEKIRQEREEAFSAEKYPDFNADDLVSLSMNQVISVETVQKILGFDGPEEMEKIKKQMLEMATLQQEIDSRMNTAMEAPMEGAEDSEDIGGDLLITLIEELSTIKGLEPENILEILGVKNLENLPPEEREGLGAAIVDLIAEETGMSTESIMAEYLNEKEPTIN